MGTSYDRYQKLQLKWILLTWPRVDFGERDQIIVRSLDFQFRHAFMNFFHMFQLAHIHILCRNPFKQEGKQKIDFVFEKARTSNRALETCI